MVSQESPVRIAVIGAGLIGQRHIQHILDEPRCRLTGVVDPGPHAEEMAEDVGTVYYRDIALFLKKGDAEGVIIATPNEIHASIGIQCAKAGLHLLVEKPIDADLNAGLIDEREAKERRESITKEADEANF